MEIITNRPIVTSENYNNEVLVTDEQQSNAFGDKFKEKLKSFKDAKPERQKSRSKRKDTRQSNKALRQKNRNIRRTAKGKDPLKHRTLKQFFEDTFKRKNKTGVVPAVSQNTRELEIDTNQPIGKTAEQTNVQFDDAIPNTTTGGLTKNSDGSATKATSTGNVKVPAENLEVIDLGNGKTTTIDNTDLNPEAPDGAGLTIKDGQPTVTLDQSQTSLATKPSGSVVVVRQQDTAKVGWWGGLSKKKKAAIIVGGLLATGMTVVTVIYLIKKSKGKKSSKKTK